MSGFVPTPRGTVEVFEPSAWDGSDLHRQVFDARDVLDDPDRVRVGQVLRIPQ